MSEEGGRDGGRERVWGKTTIGRLKYLLVWNSACTRSEVFFLLLHDDWGYKTQSTKNVATNKRCARVSYFFPKNQPKLPDPPLMSSRPCGRNKKRGRRRPWLRPVDELVAPSIHPSIHPSIWSLVKDPSSHPASRRGFFLLIHSSFINFSSIQKWVSHPFPDSVPLLIHLGGLPFLIHSSLSIFSSIPDYLPLLLIHPRLNIFSSIFGGAQLFSSILN
jgi:hypothetical protein